MKSFKAEVNIESLVDIIKDNEKTLSNSHSLGGIVSYNDHRPMITGVEIGLANTEIKRNAFRRLSNSLKSKADEFASSENIETAGVFGKLGIKLDKAASSVAKVASTGLDKISSCSECYDFSKMDEPDSSNNSDTIAFYNSMSISVVYGKRARHTSIGAIRSNIKSLELVNDDIRELCENLSSVVSKINKNLEIDVTTFGGDDTIYEIYEKDPEFVGEKIKQALNQAIYEANNILSDKGNHNLQLTLTKRLNSVHYKIRDIEDCSYDPDMAGFYTHYISILAYGEDFKVVPLHGYIGNCCTEVYRAEFGTITGMPVPFVTEHYNFDYLIENSGKLIGLSTGAVIFDIRDYSDTINPLEEAESKDENTDSASDIFDNTLGEQIMNSYCSQIDILVLP